MFEHVYATPHSVVDAERAWFERYEASFTGGGK
jgi:pyruvate dehydrogenase E1 component alpha subunit